MVAEAGSTSGSTIPTTVMPGSATPPVDSEETTVKVETIDPTLGTEERRKVQSIRI
jgi:hypothetical protein